MPVLRGILVFVLGFLSFASASQAIDTPPHEDDQFACISQVKAERIIRDFNIHTRSFGGLELCDAKVDTKKLLNDFILIEEGRFGDGPGNIYVGDFVERDNYYNWLMGMTRSVRRGHDVPYATAYNSWGNFVMQDGWRALSTLGRVGVLVHEARHTAGYRHIPCHQGPYLGTGVNGCDHDIDDGGSHAVEMEYYSRVVLQGENFHPAYKAMARLMTLGRGNMVFNETPLSQRQALLAATGQELLVLDRGELRASRWVAPESYSLKWTSAGASVVELHRQDVHSLDVDSIGFHEELFFHDEYSYYKIFDVFETPQFIDMEEVDIDEQRYLVGLNEQGELYSFVFVQGQWEPAMRVAQGQALETTSPTGGQGLFVRTEQGEVCRVDMQRYRCETMAEFWPKQSKQFIVYNGRLLELLKDGRVLDAETQEVYAPFAGLVIDELISVPVYNEVFGL